MGFFKITGKLVTYEEYKDYMETYKRTGLKQLARNFNAHKNRFIERENLHWGEEMEYALFDLNKEGEKPKLLCNALEHIQEFNKEAEEKNGDVTLTIEFGSWMVEAVPAAPYDSPESADVLSSFPQLIASRKNQIQRYFSEQNISIISLACTPTVGTRNEFVKLVDQKAQEVYDSGADIYGLNKESESRYIIDAAANPHPRYHAAIENVKQHRGEPVNVTIPLFQDSKTNMETSRYNDAIPGKIHLDSVVFAGACQCLQVTFEAQNVDHARYMYDQLLPFTPLVACLSANSPIFKGQLADIDMRWPVWINGTDCRTPAQRNPDSPDYVHKPRSSTCNHYISSHEYS